MRSETRTIRQTEIELAAYEILCEKGYAAASMLAVAKRARASNETMYRWYGDKRGLFAELVRKNAADVQEALDAVVEANRPAQEAIRMIGPKLLELLVSEKAVMLNRAAAADPTGELGEIIGRCGRDTVMPRIAKLIQRGVMESWIVGRDGKDMAETYLSLLIGDWQIRRVIGTLDAVSENDIKIRADRTFDQFCCLFAHQD